jgi:putative ABC transport system permease protein
MKKNKQIQIVLNLVKESVMFSLQSIRLNRMRTFLSLLGITIGIFTVITVFTVVDSMEKKITESIEEMGSNVVFIQKWPWGFDGDYPWWKYLNRPVPSLKEANELKKNISIAEEIVFVINTSKTVENSNKSMDNVKINGVSGGYDNVMDVEIATGRYFNQKEMINGTPLAVIGDEVAEYLFEGEAIAKTIKILGRKYQVIGVIERKGDVNFGMLDDRSIILSVNNLKTVMDIRSESNDPTIVVKAKPYVSNQELTDELTAKMRSIRRLKPAVEDDFAINESSLISSRLESVFTTISLAGWLIGGFSLLVGGFGIANIMFVSVKERTGIIGIQKALGATNYFVMMEFLFEAVFLCILGGIFGLALVFVLTSLASLAFDMPLWLQAKNVLMAVGISLIIGLISGIIPAVFASRMDPVEAIRK